MSAYLLYENQTINIEIIFTFGLILDVVNFLNICIEYLLYHSGLLLLITLIIHNYL